MVTVNWKFEKMFSVAAFGNYDLKPQAKQLVTRIRVHSMGIHESWNRWNIGHPDLMSQHWNSWKLKQVKYWVTQIWLNRTGIPGSWSRWNIETLEFCIMELVFLEVDADEGTNQLMTSQAYRLPYNQNSYVCSTKSSFLTPVSESVGKALIK